MAPKLARNVQVDGTWYRPGDEVPFDVARRITNPKAWETAEAEEASTPDVTAVKQPPRKGPGSGGQAWIEFAKSKGVEGDFGSKDELIGALESRGLIEKE